MLTDVDVALNASVIRNDNGTVLNSARDPWFYNGFVPLFETHYFNVSLSTLNHQCGITGKAATTGNGWVRVIATKEAALITIWSKNLNMPAPIGSRC